MCVFACVCVCVYVHVEGRLFSGWFNSKNMKIYNISINTKTAWRGSAVEKLLAVQAQGPKFNPQNLSKKVTHRPVTLVLGR